MTSFPPVRFLGACRSLRTQALAERLERTGLWNIFNPSIASVSGGMAIAFRAGRWPGDKPFRGYYLPPPGHNNTPVDLTEVFAASGIAVVADPKLLTLDDEIWVTFNTGHFERPNRLFAAQLHPVLSSPCELVVPGRQEIEKNWALFRKNGALHAIYSIFPPIILRASDRSSDGRIVFERLNADVGEPPSARGSLTLGSQLAVLAPDGSEFAAIVHRKFHWRKKRAYLGLPVHIRRYGDTYTVAIGRSYLAHSPSALFGDSTRHNPNLLSCTYFSGLVLTGGRAVLGYGINDVAAGFAEISAQSLGFGAMRG